MELSEIRELAKSNYASKLISKPTYLKALLLTNNVERISLNRTSPLYIDFKAICKELVQREILVDNDKNSAVYEYKNKELLKEEVVNSLVKQEKMRTSQATKDRLSQAYFQIEGEEQSVVNGNILETVINVNNIYSFQNYLLLATQDKDISSLATFKEYAKKEIQIKKGSKALDIIVPYKYFNDGVLEKGFRLEKLFDIKHTTASIDTSKPALDSILFALKRELDIQSNSALDKKEEIIQIINSEIEEFYTKDDIKSKIISHIFSSKFFEEPLLSSEDYENISNEDLTLAIKTFGSIAKKIKLKEIMDKTYVNHLAKEEDISLNKVREEILEHGKDANVLRNIPIEEHKNFIDGIIEKNKEEGIHLLSDGIYKEKNTSYSQNLVKKQLESNSKKVVKTKKQLEEEQEQATNSLFGSLLLSSDDKKMVYAQELSSLFEVEPNTKALVQIDNEPQFLAISKNIAKLNSNQVTVLRTKDDGVSELILTIDNKESEKSIVDFNSTYLSVISADNIEEQRKIIENKINSFLEENNSKMSIMEKRELINNVLDSFLIDLRDEITIGKNYLNESIIFNKLTKQRAVSRNDRKITEKNLPYKYDRYLNDISYLTTEEFNLLNNKFGLYDSDFTSKISEKKEEILSLINLETLNILLNDETISNIVNVENYENAELLQEALENRIKDLSALNNIDLSMLSISSLAVVSYYENIKIETNSNKAIENSRYFNYEQFILNRASAEETLKPNNPMESKSINYPSSPLLTKKQVANIYNQIDKAPFLGTTDGEDIKKVYAKLFKPDMTFYIVEKNQNDFVQAYGYIENLRNPEFSEWAYFDVNELIREGVELDLYFKDKFINTNGEVLNSEAILENSEIVKNLDIDTIVANKDFTNFIEYHSLNEDNLFISQLASILDVNKSRVIEKLLKESSKEELLNDDNLLSIYNSNLLGILVDEFISKGDIFVNSPKYLEKFNKVSEKLNIEPFDTLELEDIKQLIANIEEVVIENINIEEKEAKKDEFLGVNVYNQELYSTNGRRFVLEELNGSSYADYEATLINKETTNLDRYNKYRLQYLTKKEFLDINAEQKLYTNEGVLASSIVNEKNVKYKLHADSNTLVVDNLKDLYSTEEIKEKFVDKGVQWYIFSNQYSFNLNIPEHIELIKNELKLSIDTPFTLDEKLIENKTIALEEKESVVIFNRLKEIKVEWEEGEQILGDKVTYFKTFKDLQENYFLKKYPTPNDIEEGYDKIKLVVSLYNEDKTDYLSLAPYGMQRIDVSNIEGDFNPHKEDIATYFQNYYDSRGINTSDDGSQYYVGADFKSLVAEDEIVIDENVITVDVESAEEEKNENIPAVIDNSYFHFFRDGYITQGNILKTKAMSKETFKEFEFFLESNNLGEYLSKKQAKGKEFGFIIKDESILNYFNNRDSLESETLDENIKNLKLIVENEIDSFFIKKESVKPYKYEVKINKDDVSLITYDEHSNSKELILGTHEELNYEDKNSLLNSYEGSKQSTKFEDRLDSLFNVKYYIYAVNRPPHIGSLPNLRWETVNNSSSSHFPYGLVAFTTKLSRTTIDAFELIDVNQEHFERKARMIVESMGKYAPKYLTNKDHLKDFVKSAISGAYSNRIDYSRFDELVNAVSNNISNRVAEGFYEVKNEAQEEPIKENIEVVLDLNDLSKYEWKEVDNKGRLYFDKKIVAVIDSEGEVDFGVNFNPYDVDLPPEINKQIREKTKEKDPVYFVKKHYTSFDFNKKIEYQDTIDAILNDRIPTIASALKINESIKEFCDANVEFEKSPHNIIGMTLFGVTDALGSIEDLVSKIKETDLYKSYFDKQTKTEVIDNFVIESAIEYGGAKTKFKNNMLALDVIKKLENEESITLDERLTLSKYVGWGGLKQAFYKNDGTVTKGWEKEAELLKSSLSESEYEEIRKTVLNAHYTPIEVSKSIWRLMERYGFDGGTILEPSVGIGTFVGTMPKKFIPSTNITGVEIDKKTSLIAQTLYPSMKVLNKGFEEVENKEYSLIIGNPPFGSTRLFDEKYNSMNLSIHNYFFVKSIDNLKENGVLAMVVSNAFLDSNSDVARKYIGEKARLLTAIRLPNNMFLENANTEVTTDIVVFQKTSNKDLLNYEEWGEIDVLNDAPINKYFVKNKNHLLGEWGLFGTMYQGGTPALISKNKEESLNKLNSLIENAETKFYKRPEKLGLSSEDYEKAKALKIFDLVDKTIDTSFSNLENGVDFTGISENSYFIMEDELYYREFGSDYRKATTKFNSKGEEIELKENEIAKIKGMVAISNVANRLRKAQISTDFTDQEVEDLRAELNTVYDAFVKEYGYLSVQNTKNLFEEDSNVSLLLSLEKDYEKAISKEVAKKTGETARPHKATKSDIFTKRTQYPHIRESKAENIQDAYFISLNEYGYLNTNFIANLLNIDEETAVKQLRDNDLGFYDVSGELVTKSELLQGNLKEKLKKIVDEKSFEVISEALPKDLHYLDISITLGANWIPKDIISDFINSITQRDDAKAFLLEHDATWNTSFVSSMIAENKFGTTDVNFERVLSSALNSRTITVTKKDENGNQRVDKEATMVANQKVQELKNYWNDWVYNDENRAKRLQDIYNEKFNVFAINNHSGEHLKLIGSSNDVSLRPHQKNAVQRALTTGKVLLDHTVGTGKTFTAIATAMEMKRTNRANKPMIVVPNHLTLEWGSQFLRLYPNANILVPSAKDFSKKRRKVLLNRIATGDYDAIIMAHSQFSMIESDIDFKRSLIMEEIEKISKSIDLLRMENNQDARSVRSVETQRANLEFKLNNLNNMKRDEDILTFEEMGVDMLIVDEAHEFKNLQYSTSMQRIGGLGNPKGSKKAFDMFAKVQSLLKKTGDSNLVFLTGTPISNSIAEMYTMQRYMQYKELDSLGAVHFDSWVKLFADAVTDWEVTATQEYKLRTILSKFKNIPELIALYKQFADVVTNDDVNKMLLERGERIPTPRIKGGRPQNIVLERSNEQASFIGELDENDEAPEGSLLWRSENIPKKAEKGADNMLVILNDAKKCSLDMRIIDESYPDNPNSKVNSMLEIAMETYKQWEEDKGVQIIFCDMSTPKGLEAEKEKERLEALIELAEEGDEEAEKELEKYSQAEVDSILSSNNFSVYQDVKTKLIEKGIPENEIAFIHDAKTDKQKEELFGKCRSGKIRFILGSTSKMGAGTNIQDRLVALHHLDVAWRPSDLEQREGRIIRQGNKLYEKYGDDFEVGIYRYATKDTLDTVLWGTIERKAKFIEQIKKGVAGREVEDLGSESINASEMKALTSGNPLMLEQITLSNDIKKLESLEKEFRKSLFYATEELNSIKNNLKEDENKIEDMVKDYNYYPEIENKLLEIDKITNITKEDMETLEKARAVRTFTKVNEAMKLEKEEKQINSLIKFNEDVKISNYEELFSYIEKSLKKNNESPFVFGTAFGFDLVAQRSKLVKDIILKVEGEHSWKNRIPLDKKNVIGNIIQTISSIPTRYNITLEKIERAKNKIVEFENANSSFATTFKDKDLLEQKRARLFEVMRELEIQREEKIEKAKNKHSSNLTEEDSVVEKQPKVEWIDPNKEVPTKELLKKDNIDVLDMIDYKIVGNCLVLENQLEREDYKDFEKIFKRFGGEWNQKMKAIVFSNDGLERIQDALGIKEAYLSDIVNNYSENSSNSEEAQSRNSYRQKI